MLQAFGWSAVIGLAAVVSEVWRAGNVAAGPVFNDIPIVDSKNSKQNTGDYYFAPDKRCTKNDSFAP